jgi:hypothetical protein
MGATDMLKYVIVLGMALLFTAYTIPMGLQAIAEANLTGVNAIITNVFTIVLPLLAIFGLALGFMPPELKAKVGLD